jgi:hypothetical protein
VNRRVSSGRGRRITAGASGAFNPNALSGLVVHLDAKDLSAGAVTSWVDRKNGYAFTGTATRNAVLNGRPTVTFNGTTDRLSTAGNITQVGGVSACTFVIVALDTWYGDNAVVAEIGDGTSIGTQVVVSSRDASGNARILFANKGNSAGNSISYFLDSWATPGVLCAVNDFGAAAGAETSTLRFNGLVPTVVNTDTANNTNNCVALRMSLGQRQDNTLPWSGSIAKVLVYNRRLTTAEMQYLEAGLMLEFGFYDSLAPFIQGTFTRASEGSYYMNAPTGGGTAFIGWEAANRLRYDAVDNTQLALFEGSQTNLCFWSEDLNQAAWVKTGATISGTTAVAPDGAADCCTVSFSAAAGDMVMQPVAGTANGVTYMTTVFARRTSGTGNVRLRVLDRNGAAQVSSNISISTTWKRIEYAVSWGTGVATPEVGIINDSAGGAQTVEVWGFDVKSGATVGAFPTSYIRTTGASATRSADALTYASMPTRMASGKWAFALRPLYSNSETLTISAAFGMDSAADSSIATSAGLVASYAVGVAKFSRTPITYARNQAMTITPDCGLFTMTVAGAATGDGTGATGTTPAYATSFLRVGALGTGARPTFARIGEPYAV